MLNFILDEEEQTILDAFDAGEIQPIPDPSKEIKKHRQYATATFKNDKRINIRLTNPPINPRKQPHE